MLLGAVQRKLTVAGERTYRSLDEEAVRGGLHSKGPDEDSVQIFPSGEGQTDFQETRD